MHDLDRTQLELDGQELVEEAEADELLEELLGEATEFEEEADSETEELELASQLLEISDEAELDQFLGSLIAKALRGARAVARTPAGKQVATDVRRVLKSAAAGMPTLGKSIGGQFGGPGARIGESVGTALRSGAEQWFGLELEGLSPEDREFEVARRYVRFARDVARTAGRAAATSSPSAAVRTALRTAARRHAPGLAGVAVGRALTPPPQFTKAGRARTGRWVRKGRTIVLYQ